MNEHLKTLIEDYRQTNWKALLKEDLGKYHLKEIEPHLDFIKKIIDRIIDSPYLGSLLQSQNCQNLLQDLLQTFLQHRNQIADNKDANQNQQIVSNISLFKSYIAENFHSLFAALDIYEKSQPAEPLATDKESLLFKETQKEISKIKQIQSQLAEQAVKSEASRYGDFFKDEAEKNKKLSKKFGIAIIVCSIAAIVFAHWLFRFDQNIETSSFAELLIKGDMINKIFIFSVILFAISLIRKEYLALRHQFTLNTHRHNALSSHKNISDAIEKTGSAPDKEISDAILLELAKAMFSPQDTGFVKSQPAAASGNRIIEISKSLVSPPKE